MIYEMLVYDHEEGRADAVRERFIAEAAPRFPLHNIELVGVFVDTTTQRLTYLTRFPDMESRAQAWKSFKNDPDWLAVKAKSELDGPLLVKQHSTLLDPAMSGLPID